MVSFGKNTGAEYRRALAPLVLVVIFFAIAILLAATLAKTSAFFVLGGVVAILLLMGSFLSPEFGVAILIMSMLLSPEFGAGAAGAGTTVETSRSVVIRLDDILLIILLGSWFARMAIHKELGFILKNPINRPIGIYILSCFISTTLGLLSGDVRAKVGFFFVIRYIEYFIVFFMGINFIQSVKIMRRFMKIAFFTAALVAIYGLYQIPSGIRVSAPFEGDAGEPNTMGGYLLLMMAMAAGQLITSRGIRPLMGWSSYILLLMIPLLFTGSRASWLGIPAAMLAFFLFSQRKKEILMLTIILLVAAPAILPQGVKDRILFTFTQGKELTGGATQVHLGGVRLDTSTSARIESWRIAMNGWMKKPILGWGISGIIFIDAQYVRTLAETGLFGMVALLWLFWAYFQAGRAAMRASPDRFQRGLALGYIAGFFGLVLHGSGSNTFIILRIMEPFMLFTAMIIRIPDIQAAREKEWKEIEGEKEEEARPEEAAESEEEAESGPVAAEIARAPTASSLPSMRFGPQKPTVGETAPSTDRYKKKLSEQEEFLEREKKNQERLAKEEKIRSKEGPKFRYSKTREGQKESSFRKSPQAPTPDSGGNGSEKPMRAADVARGKSPARTGGAPRNPKDT